MLSASAAQKVMVLLQMLCCISLCAMATKTSLISHAWVSQSLSRCQRISKFKAGGDRWVRKVEVCWSRGTSWFYTCRKAQLSRMSKPADSSHAFFLQDPTKAAGIVLPVSYGYMWKATPKWGDVPHKKLMLQMEKTKSGIIPICSWEICRNNIKLLEVCGRGRNWTQESWFWAQNITEKSIFVLWQQWCQWHQSTTGCGHWGSCTPFSYPSFQLYGNLGRAEWQSLWLNF